jgi:tetratricopeptide (TPR) repeat protein
MRKAKGETNLALTDLNEGLTRQPDNVAALTARAEIKHAKGDMAGSIADYDAVLKRDPKDPGILRTRAMALIETKSYAKAVDDLDRAIRLDPRNAQAYYQRGLAREHDDQRVLAIADYKLALTHDRRMDDARKALARAMTDERNHKPHVAARTDKVDQATKQTAPSPKQPDVVAVESGDKTGSTPKSRIEVRPDKSGKKIDKNEQKIARTATVSDNKKDAKDERAAPSGDKKPSDKRIARLTHDGKDQRLHDRKTVERGSRHERDARKHNDRPKTAAHKPVKRKVAAAPPRVRYYRAGSRETRFTDIWNDKR